MVLHRILREQPKMETAIKYAKEYMSDKKYDQSEIDDVVARIERLRGK